MQDVHVDTLIIGYMRQTTQNTEKILARFVELEEGVGLVVHFPLEDVAKINTP